MLSQANKLSRWRSWFSEKRLDISVEFVYANEAPSATGSGSYSGWRDFRGIKNSNSSRHCRNPFAQSPLAHSIFVTHCQSPIRFRARGRHRPSCESSLRSPFLALLSRAEYSCTFRCLSLRLCCNSTQFFIITIKGRNDVAVALTLLHSISRLARYNLFSIASIYDVFWKVARLDVSRV